jgi:hypothetical protein
MQIPGPTPTKINDTRVAKLLDERRFCYVIPESAYTEGKGFRVSIAIEREPGHFPTGNTPEGGDIEPWYWGHTFEEAREIADRENKDRLGLDPVDAWKIVASTMTGRPATRSQKRAQARARTTTKKSRKAQR